MSAMRHVVDAETAAMDLSRELIVLGEAVKLGGVITLADIEHLRLAARVTLTRIALAKNDLQRIPQVDSLPHGQTITLDATASTDPAVGKAPMGAVQFVGRRIDAPPLYVHLRAPKGATR